MCDGGRQVGRVAKRREACCLRNVLPRALATRHHITGAHLYLEILISMRDIFNIKSKKYKEDKKNNIETYRCTYINDDVLLVDFGYQ